MASKIYQNLLFESQVFHLRLRHPDTMLFFRSELGYELFGEDAEIVRSELQTPVDYFRHNGEFVLWYVVPESDMEALIGRLTDSGHLVAICERIGEIIGEN